VTKELPFRHEGVFVTREVLLALVLSFIKLVAPKDTNSLPPIASVIAGAPTAIMKDLKEQGISNLVTPPAGNLEHMAFFVSQLGQCYLFSFY
jgi:hypothetical protein